MPPRPSATAPEQSGPHWDQKVPTLRLYGHLCCCRANMMLLHCGCTIPPLRLYGHLRCCRATMLLLQCGCTIHLVVRDVAPREGQFDPAKDRKSAAESTKPSVQSRRPNPFRQRLRYRHRTTHYQICHQFRHRKMRQKSVKIGTSLMILVV